MIGSLLVVLTNAATALTLAHGRLKKKSPACGEIQAFVAEANRTPPAIIPPQEKL